jgi:NADPH:quinone reductase-like Zn-dependent oxidoreductase
MDARFYRRLAPTAVVVALLTQSAWSAETIRQWQFAPKGQASELALREVQARAPAAREVAVRVHAVSLNRRDLMMVAGQYGRGGTQPNSVPLSDGAGEVIAVGAGVTRFKVGDRVAGIFFEDWLDGAPTASRRHPQALDVRRSGDVAVRGRHGVGRPVQARPPRER